MSNAFEVKQKLYDVYKKYKKQGFMSDKFMKSLDGFYSAADPNIFVNRIKSYITKFDEGKGVDVYKDFINECKFVLEFDNTVDTSNDESKVNELVDESKSENINDVKTDDKSDNDEDVQVENDLQSEDDVQSTDVDVDTKMNVKVNVDNKDVNLSKVTVLKPNVKVTKPNNVSKNKNRLTNLDLTSKTLKVPIANGLIDLFDKKISESSRDFIMGSGTLSDEELMILTENELNTSIF